MLSFVIHSYLVLALTATAVLLPENRIESNLHAPKDVVAFYNLHVKPEDKEIFVRNQVRAINESGLLKALDAVFYITSGTDAENVKIGTSDKYVHLAHHGENGTELQTLSYLQRFCKANSASKVLYFHDMITDSYPHLNVTTNSSAIAKLHDYLSCFVLRPDCIKALDSHDTCGWRISPTPMTHYSGNYWWARCEYINTLVDPLLPLNNPAFINQTQALNGCLGTDPESFASTWIGTGPILLPADCMSAQIDRSYIWGTTHLPELRALCSNKTSAAHTCHTASTFDHVHNYKRAIDTMNALLPKECQNNRKEVSKLSALLYKEAPHTYLEWMDRLASSKLIEDGTLVRFSDSPEIYLAKDNELRGVPDLKTFIKMGRDLSEVRSKLAKERQSYTFGSILPFK